MAGGEEIRGGGKIGAKVAATRLGDGWTQTAGLVTAPELHPAPSPNAAAGRVARNGLESVLFRSDRGEIGR